MKIEKTEYKLLDKTTEHICVLDINTIEELDEAIEPVMDDIRAHFYWATEDKDTGGYSPSVYGFQFVLYNGSNPDLTKEDVYKSLVFGLHCPEEKPELTLYNYDVMGFTNYWHSYPEERYYPEVEYRIIISADVVSALYEKYETFHSADSILSIMSREEAWKILGEKRIY